MSIGIKCRKIVENMFSPSFERNSHEYKIKFYTAQYYGFPILLLDLGSPTGRTRRM